MTSRASLTLRSLNILASDWSIAHAFVVIQPRSCSTHLDRELGHKRLAEAEDSHTARGAGN